MWNVASVCFFGSQRKVGVCSIYLKGAVCAQSLSCVRLFATLWTVARQAPFSKEILQSRILGWVAMPSSKGSSQLRDRTPSLLHWKRILYRLSHQGSPRILGWVAVPFSRGSSQPRDWTQVSCIAGRFFTIWTTKEALKRLESNKGK